MKNSRIFILLIFVICLVMLIIVGGTFYYKQAKQKANEDKTQPFQEEVKTDLATISYEGTFQAKGVVVRVETNTLTIMPTIEKEEYREEEKFYCENSQSKNLRQGQEVFITFHYNKSSQENFTYEPIVEKVEILQEKSTVEIPRDVLVKAYSSKENIHISINQEQSTNKQIVFTIEDKNALPYDYSTMQYRIDKYNPPPTKTEVVQTENGMATTPYDPWPELPKIAPLEKQSNYGLDANGKVLVEIDWSQIYGELKEGTYRFTLSTVSSPRKSIANASLTEYPYDGITIEINFTIEENGIEYEQISVH